MLVTVDRWNIKIENEVGWNPTNDQGAALRETIDLDNKDGAFLSVIISDAAAPNANLVYVTVRYQPFSVGFSPALLITDATLFIGAGEKALCYDLDTPEKLWMRDVSIGFWRWAQEGDVVLMHAELEFAAFDRRGNELWSIGVEPPWDYCIRADYITLENAGQTTTFPIRGSKIKSL